MRRRWIIAALAVLVACLLPVFPAGASRPNQDDYTNTLPAGHVLFVHPAYPNAELVSTSGRFTFWVSTGGLQLDEDVETTDGGIGNSSYNLSLHHWPHEAYFAMRRDGNLVFRNGAGRVLWSTHTAGTGDHNYARMLDSGALVVRTASGRTVWSSRTTSMIRVTGEHVLAGHTLVDRTAHPMTELTMRTTGDLVLRRGSRRVWHTDTRVHGSRLVVSRAGRMVIVAPDGAWMWHSPKVGSPAVLNVAMRGRITFANLRHFRQCWVRPAGSNPDCGAG